MARVTIAYLPIRSPRVLRALGVDCADATLAGLAELEARGGKLAEVAMFCRFVDLEKRPKTVAKRVQAAGRACDDARALQLLGDGLRFRLDAAEDNSVVILAYLLVRTYRHDPPRLASALSAHLGIVRPSRYLSRIANRAPVSQRGHAEMVLRIVDKIRANIHVDSANVDNVLSIVKRSDVAM